VAGRKVFFAGDTGYGPHLAAIGGAWGPVDVALLPIGAYAPREVMAPVHLDPEEAVRAYLDLGGRGALVPIHWGTFRLSDEPLDEPPRRLAAAWQAAGLPPERLWRLRPGEVRRLG
jgi:N-acyl-phosphatidylethanolamine-hydrolysing phospholipase D